MQIPPAPYRVFVDYENVPEIDLGLVAEKPVHVTLLIGKNQKKIDLALVRQIHRLASQVELIEVGVTGRNALDLTLALYLGQALQNHPAARFCIVSKDKDFDGMIAHLKERKTPVTRHESFAALPFFPPSKKPVVSAKSAPADRRTKEVARLSDTSLMNRPSTHKRLLADLKAHLGPDTTDDLAADVIRELTDKKVLQIDAQSRVRYLPAG